MKSLTCLKAFVKAERIFAAQFTASGAFSDVVLKYYNWEKKEYEEKHVREQIEVASLLGDAADGSPGKPAIHALRLWYAVLAGIAGRSGSPGAAALFVWRRKLRCQKFNPIRLSPSEYSTAD